nr:putative reverse transcriptase domain-containing protein [Tanacetum cinerariifolium]
DEELVIPLDEVKIDDKLHFIEEPVKIMDREVKQLKQSRIPIVKVRWDSKRRPEYTWERKDQMWKKVGFPLLKFDGTQSEDRSTPGNERIKCGRSTRISYYVHFSYFT